MALQNETPVGCVSLMFDLDAPVGSDTQLRGMAVRSECQKLGVGASLLAQAYAIGRERSCGYWCNARQSAIGFYERQGWVAEGEMFEFPVVGLHVIMRWKLR